MARKVLISIRKGLEVNLPVLADGELGFTTDTKKLYIGTATGNALLVAAQTVGDMLKTIYDTDNDGKVDWAENVDWVGIQSKPIIPKITTDSVAPSSPAAGDFWYKVI